MYEAKKIIKSLSTKLSKYVFLRITSNETTDDRVFDRFFCHHNYIVTPHSFFW